MPAGEPYYWTRLAQQARACGEHFDSFCPPIVTADFTQAFDRVVQSLNDARRTTEDKLTEQQFIEAMRQAPASGNFLRHVHDDGSGQAITYEPFREREKLKARIRTLETALIAIQEAFDAVQ